jgi:hypothetical protein
MRPTIKAVCAAVVMTALMASGVGRIEARADGQGPGDKGAPPIPLKVTVTISRWEGEKRTANLPFVLWVNTGGSANVQMGSDVPVPTMTMKEGVTVPVQSFNYRSLGTNITSKAEAVSDGLYRLQIDVQDTQVFRLPTGATTASPAAVYQNFRSSNSPILRDGQTVQFAVATDKTSGEVIKLDVTLNLVK